MDRMGLRVPRYFFSEYVADKHGVWFLHGHPLTYGVEGSIEEAKAAAQSDYEQRILSAIDTQAVEERIKRLEEALEWYRRRSLNMSASDEDVARGAGLLLQHDAGSRADDALKGEA